MSATSTVPGVPVDLPPIRFTTSRGARLACQVIGDGPADIVAIPPMAQRVEMARGWPEITCMLERFGSFSRFLHFHERGTGAAGLEALDETGEAERAREARDAMMAELDDA